MREASKKTWVVVATVLIFAGVGICAYWALSREPVAPVVAPLHVRTDPTAEPPSPEEPAPEIPQPTAPPRPEPPLTDDRIRRLAGKLSSHPGIARWLTTEHLAGKFVALVELVRNGQSPRKLLPFLKPDGSFATIERGGHETLDPKSYRRYDRVAETIGSVDVDGCAQLLRKLEPLLERNYRELGPPKKSFRWALTQAMIALLQVPAIDGDIPLERIEVTLKIASPELEAMTDAQKHLFRMGPDNIRKIQAKLRQIGRSLGWSSELETVKPVSY